MPKQTPPRRGRGRPPLPPEARRRANITLRVRDATKAKIEAAAGLNGRSASEEIEARVERSFEREQAGQEVLVAEFGPRLAGLIFAMGVAMRNAAATGTVAETGTYRGTRLLFDSPFVFDQAAQAALAVLEGLRPAGTIELPTPSPRTPFPDVSEVAGRLGTDAAAEVLALIGAPARSRDPDQRVWAEAVRKLMGLPNEAEIKPARRRSAK